MPSARAGPLLMTDRGPVRNRGSPHGATVPRGEAASCGLYLVQVAAGPGAHAVDRVAQCLARLGEAVVHAGRVSPAAIGDFLVIAGPAEERAKYAQPPPPSLSKISAPSKYQSRDRRPDDAVPLRPPRGRSRCRVRRVESGTGSARSSAHRPSCGFGQGRRLGSPGVVGGAVGDGELPQRSVEAARPMGAVMDAGKPVGTPCSAQPEPALGRMASGAFSGLCRPARSGPRARGRVPRPRCSRAGVPSMTCRG